MSYGEWQPIETAPKDGSWVVLTGGRIDYAWDTDRDDGNTYPTMVIGQWSQWFNGGQDDGKWQFAWYDGGYYGEYEEPRFWQPLPAPPA